MNEENELLKDNEELKKEAKIFNVSSLIVIMCIIAISVFVLITYQNNKLTPEELQVIEVVEEYKRYLKNPESLQIHQIRMEKYTSTILVMLDVTAENGFGGSSRTKVAFSIEDDDIMYLGNDMYADSTITDYSSTEKKQLKEIGEYIQMLWKSDDYIEINKKKILKNISK